MKGLQLTAALLGATALAACTPPHPQSHFRAPMRVVERLDCPQNQGELTLVSAAGDGKSCDYKDEGGGLVKLQLAPLGTGDADAALAPIEAELRTELPALPSAASAPAPPVPPPPGKTTPPATPASDDRVNIDLPGVHIHADEGGHATVQAGGVDVNADNQGAHVNVHNRRGFGRRDENVSINANDNGAEIRVTGHGDGIRHMLILTAKQPGPHGYRLAGYAADGPATGPLVVATVKSSTEDHDELYEDLRALVKHNVGG